MIPSAAGTASLRSRLRTVAQIGPVEVRHRDGLDAVDLAEVVNAHDVLVRHLAGEDQLLFEPALHFPRCLGIARCLGPNDFQRDALPELGVPHLVDGAHPADPENLDDG